MAVSLHKIQDLFEDDRVIQRLHTMEYFHSDIVDLRKTLIHREVKLFLYFLFFTTSYKCDSLLGAQLNTSRNEITHSSDFRFIFHHISPFGIHSHERAYDECMEAKENRKKFQFSKLSASKYYTRGDDDEFCSAPSFLSHHIDFNFEHQHQGWGEVILTLWGIRKSFSSSLKLWRWKTPGRTSNGSQVEIIEREGEKNFQSIKTTRSTKLHIAFVDFQIFYDFSINSISMYIDIPWLHSS